MTEVAKQGKQIESKSGKNYSCAQIGEFADLDQYELAIQGKVRNGKVFLKEAAQFTAMEISFTTLSPGKNTPFVHHHKQDEEAYIVVQGKGRMQVDDDVFPISQGSVVRVATEGRRALGNDSDQPLVYICVQAKQGSLEQYTSGDGVRDDEPPKV